MARQKNRFHEVTGNAFLAGLLLILCFPRLEPVTDTGIDPPLLWAYNYFFVNGIQSGVDVLFTHGPLAFLILPQAMGNNFEITLLLTSLVYVLFFYGFLELGRHLHEGRWMLTALLLLIIGHLVPMVYLIAGLTVSAILLYHEKRNISWLILACFSAVFGFYIKAGFGFLALFPIFSYAVIYFFRYRKLSIPIVCIAGPALAYIITWLAVYGNLNGLGTFLYATYELAKGNSNGAALYPQNDWMLVGSAILCLAAIPFAINQKRVYLIFALFALSLFGTWKHGFSREDASHVRGSIVFLILAFSFVLIYLRNARPVHLALLALPPVLLYMNMQGFVDERHPYTITTMRFVNFHDQVLNRKEHLKSFDAITRKNLEGSKLDDETRRLLGDRTVDIYPFDFSFVTANGLNWQPRPVLQTYASYTTWLDKRNANHFTAEKAADFILWHLSGDMHGQLTGVDNRTVLNDEPAGLMSILKIYRLVRKTNRIMLFQRIAEPVIGQPKEISNQEGQWDQWMSVPPVKDGILRVKLKAAGTLLRSLKSFLYKDEAFFVEYKLSNNEIRKFRIILSNAQDGVWVNPLIIHASDSLREYPVTQVRFLSSNKRMMKEKFGLAWEHTPVLGTPPDTVPYQEAFKLFGKVYQQAEPVLQSRNEFDKSVAGWTEPDPDAMVKNVEKGGMVYQLDADLFSPSFSIPLSALSPGDSSISVYASVYCHLPHKSKAKLVISVNDSSGLRMWEGMHMQYFVTEYERWEYVYAQHDLPAGLPPSARLSVSVWNVGTRPVLIDDLEIKVFKKADPE